MAKLKTILLDLYGTLVNTMLAKFEIFRDGKADVNINEVPIFERAKDFVENLKQSGHEVFIVSDSHPRYVEPIAKKIFDLDSLSLAYKPNLEKLTNFINKKSSIKLPSNKIFMVGDSPLDK